MWQANGGGACELLGVGLGNMWLWRTLKYSFRIRERLREEGEQEKEEWKGGGARRRWDNG